MATFDYSGLKATADRLIDRFGKSATLVSYTTSGTAYDPTVSPSTASATVVELSYSLTNREESLVQRGDKLFLVKAGAGIGMNDKLRLDSADYAMVDVQPLNPGGTVLLYEVQARV